ncbi:MFS transporter [Actinomadura rugatobispora]|uniref:MFS transporter n=1 Tax=Actinomadura rugatobispora TaxID=1994 RepID=A0ABW1AA97_9ACTN|nr:MFS transporter [Actinomadura rugatobispora]
MSASMLPHDASPARLRAWLGLAVLALPTLLLAVDLTVLHLAVPQLSADLRPSGVQLLWIVDIYGFMIAGFLVTMGALGDRLGRRRLLMLGAAGFGAASLLAAYSASAEALIAARGLMGMAGATLMPSTLALISDMFRVPRQRGLAIGVWAAVFSVGVAAGPVLGGVLLEHLWWGSVFVAGVPVLALLLVTAPMLLPEVRHPRPGRIDLLSVVLTPATTLPVIYGVKELSVRGPALVPLAFIAVGAAVCVLFVRRQRRLAEPLLDLRLFTDRTLGSSLVMLLVSAATVGGIYLFVAQYLQLVRQMSPLEAGLWLLPSAGALLIASTLAPLAARRVRPGYVVGAALVVSAAGFVLLTQVDARSGTLLTVLGFTLAYAGGSPATALGTDMVVGSAPPSKAGAASALSETGTELGVAMGVAALGSVGTAVYRDGLPKAAPGETLTETTALAQQLPPEPAARLLETARDAFTTGMNTAALCCAVLLTALAVAAVALLRHLPPTSNADPQQEPATSERRKPQG